MAIPPDFVWTKAERYLLDLFTFLLRESSILLYAAEYIWFLFSFTDGDQFVDRISSGREFLFIFGHNISGVHFIVVVQVVSVFFQMPSCLGDFFHRKAEQFGVVGFKFDLPAGRKNLFVTA